jgi:Predicted acyltransferase
MNYRILSYDELNKDQLYDILAHRSKVFIVGMKITYDDMDSRDQRAWHLLATDDDGKILGYCRILPAGEGHEAASFGRVSVKECARHKGLGAEIVKRSVDFITTELGFDEIEISAMSYLDKFYGELGFKVTSGLFDIQGVPHYMMRYKA